ncbi:MAG TPA: glycosyltransferase family 4 protein [Anaerolineales bacterium]|nr:glycosyltransferase family 4 protein [Anaerolineales bacterium]
MKILIIISETPPILSGVSRVADKLSQGLRNRGHQVDMISIHDIPRMERGEIRLSSMFLKLGHLKARLSDYDVIHLHGPVPTFSDVFLLLGLRGLRSPRPRLVYTHHAPIDLKILPLRPLIWAYNIFQERLACNADHVVVTTPTYGLRLARYVPASDLSVIPWGVDFNRFVTPVNKDGPFTVVYLGQIRPYKGLPVLLNALVGLSDVRLSVIGNGHFTRACQIQARDLNLPDVTFWGALTDEEMIHLLKQAHVIVLPSVSRSEAFGIALLEGMAAGLVPVASHLPGVADVISNEGITFQPGHPEALRAILIRLRDDPLLRVHLASLAQAKARLYSWNRVIFGYERVFNQVTTKSLSKPVYVIDPPTQPILKGYSD